MRRLVREHELRASDLIQPLFVVHGSNIEREIGSMPGVFQRSVDDALEREVDRVQALGIPAVLLFGLPAAKDEIGSENFAEDGIVQRALRHLRAAPSRSAPDHRRLLLRVHQPRPLRRPARRWRWTTTPLSRSWAGWR